MGREKISLGSRGEDVAAEYLKQKGYRITDKNVRTVFGEIDIVAKKDGMTVFVEVKARSSSSLGPPSISVTALKRLHIIRSALCYLKKCGAVDSYWRIDVVSVNMNAAYDVESIELIENAVESNG